MNFKLIIVYLGFHYELCVPKSLFKTKVIIISIFSHATLSYLNSIWLESNSVKIMHTLSGEYSNKTNTDCASTVMLVAE